MTAYFHRVPSAPRVLSLNEQQDLLRVTGERRGAYRDHVLFSMALGTALRSHELVALTVGDVQDDQGRIRRRLGLQVFKRSNPDAEMQQVMLSEALRGKLQRYLAQHHPSREPSAPLFYSRKGGHLSTRHIRTLLAKWQRLAGISRPVNVHGLRHTACTNLYRQTKDIRLTQRFARHASLLSTMRYSHPTEEDLVRAVAALPC